MNKKRTIVFTVLSVGFILGIVVFLNLGKFLIVNDNLEKADAIVVFSGDNGPRTEEAVR